MIKVFKIAPLTRILITIYFVILILNFVFHGLLYQLFALNPQSVIHNFEIWRLITFVFAPGNIESTLLLSFVFWFIGPNLESGFSRGKFLILLTITSLIQGSLFTLLFIRDNNFISGGEGIALILLSLYVFLEVTSNTRRISFKRLISLPTSVFVTVAWFSAVILHHSFTANEDLAISIISGAFGVMTGSIIFMHIKLIDFLTARKKSTSATYSVPKPEELIESLSTRKEYQQKHLFRAEEEYSSDEESNEYFSEERLNRILDKISEYGREALTADEELYLKEYSENL